MSTGYSFEIIEDETDDPVLTMRVSGPKGTFMSMAEVYEEPGGVLRLIGLHIHGINGLEKNQLGWPEVRRVIRVVMLELDLNEVIIEGAVRQTGACPGRKPKPIRVFREHSSKTHPKSGSVD